MQLLEQLVNNEISITESELLMDCASTMGYLECMEEIYHNQSYVPMTEGIIQNVINGIKTIIGKLIGLLRKAKDFFASKIKKEKANNKPSNPKEKDNGQKPEDRLRAHPYTGPMPESRLEVLEYMTNAYNSLMSETANIIVKIINYICNIAEGNLIEKPDKDVLTKNFCDKISESISGSGIEVTSFDTITHLPMQLYNKVCKPDKWSGVFTKEEFDAFSNGAHTFSAERFKMLIKMNTVLDSAVDALKVAQTRISDIIKTHEISENKLDMGAIGILSSLSSAVSNCACIETEKFTELLYNEDHAMIKYITTVESND